MTATTTATCLNSEGRVKKRYASEHAAKRDLARSQRWRRRATWPITWKCNACHGWHLGHAGEM